MIVKNQNIPLSMDAARTAKQRSIQSCYHRMTPEESRIDRRTESEKEYDKRLIALGKKWKEAENDGMER